MAEDILRARELDDVVHGEEERLVASLGDQRQFVLDQLAHFSPRRLARRRGRKASGEAFFGEPPQVRGRRFAWRHDLLGIFVTQFFKRKLTASSDGECLGEPRGGIEALQGLQRPQMALAVRVQGVAGLRDRSFQPDRGQRVLQGAPLALVHVHVARGHKRQAGQVCDSDQFLATCRVAGVEQALGRDPQRAGKAH